MTTAFEDGCFPDRVAISPALPRSIVVTVQDYVSGLSANAFSEYRHRFEPKLMLKREHYSHPSIDSALKFLRCDTLVNLLSNMFGIPGMQPASHYFTAFYVYRPGDYLQPHIDAAIHDDERKVVTINCYLSDCAGGELTIGSSIFPCVENSIVAFVNHDQSQHGVQRVVRDWRMMITTGLSLPADRFPMPRFTRTNRKAYFVPFEGQEWTEQDHADRDERASDDWRPM